MFIDWFVKDLMFIRGQGGVGQGGWSGVWLELFFFCNLVLFWGQLDFGWGVILFMVSLCFMVYVYLVIFER